MSSGSSTVHTCTASPALCASFTNRGETTRVRAAGFGHLKRLIRHPPGRHAAPRSIQRHPDLEPAAARGDVGRDGARARAVPTRLNDPRHTRSRGAGAAHLVHDGAGQLGPGFLQFDDDAASVVPREHVAQRRHIQRAPARRRCDRRAGPWPASCDRASHRDGRRPLRRARDGRRARGHRRRPPARDRTPRSCFPGRSCCRRGAQRRGAATSRIAGMHRAILG